MSEKDTIRRELLGHLDNLWMNEGPEALHRYMESEMHRIDQEPSEENPTERS